MSTSRDPGNQPPEQPEQPAQAGPPEHGSDETVVGGIPFPGDDATRVSGIPVSGDETRVGGVPVMGDDTPAPSDDATVVGYPLPPVPSDAAPWGAPPPPAPAGEPGQAGYEPSGMGHEPLLPVPPEPENDATMVGIYAPSGPWMEQADRAAWAQQVPPNPSAPTAPATDDERRRKTKRRIIVWVIVLVVLALIVTGAFITRSALAKGKYGPQHQVDDYLQALVDGKASTATKLLDPNVTTDQRALLGDDLYKATKGRPTSFTIDSTTIDGDHATVRASVEQDGKSDRQTFTLSKDGRRDLFFSAWKLDSGPQQSLSIGTVPQKLTVNGVDVDLGKATDQGGESGTKLPVLPGDYTFVAPKGSKYVTYGKDVTVSKRLGGASDDSGDSKADAPVSFTSSYTGAVYTDAEAQLRTKIAGCTKDKDMFVKDCLAVSWENTRYDATKDITRAWDDGNPTVKITGTDQDGSESTADSADQAPDLHGDLVAQIDNDQLRVDGKVRDEDDDDGEWHDGGSRTFSVFAIDSDRMKFPIKIDGDKLTVTGLSQIDRYDSRLINPDNQKKYSQYKAMN